MLPPIGRGGSRTEGRNGYNGYMVHTVAARELKNRLGTYLRLVREGATLVVTDRGRPIAELRPLQAPGDDEERQLAEMAALGFVTLPTRKGFATIIPLRLSGPSLSDTIIEGREDRF